MKLSSLSDLAEVFRLMGEHGIAQLEFDGLKVVRTSQPVHGGFPILGPESPGDEDSGGRTEEEEELLYWSEGQ